MPREGWTDRITSLAIYAIRATAIAKRSVARVKKVRQDFVVLPASAGLEIDPILTEIRAPEQRTK